jgi:hypothetical protein
MVDRAGDDEPEIGIDSPRGAPVTDAIGRWVNVAGNFSVWTLVTSQRFQTATATPDQPHVVAEQCCSRKHVVTSHCGCTLQLPFLRFSRGTHHEIVIAADATSYNENVRVPAGSANSGNLLIRGATDNPADVVLISSHGQGVLMTGKSFRDLQ